MATQAATVEASSTTTNVVSNPRCLLFIRLFWLILLASQIALIGVLMFTITPVDMLGQPVLDATMALNFPVSLVNGIYLSLVLSHSVIPSIVSYILMWHGRNERTALLFAFFFLPFMTSAFSYAAIFSNPLIGGFSIVYFTISAYSIGFLFPTGTFISKWFTLAYCIVVPVLIVSELTGFSIPLFSLARIGIIGVLLYRLSVSTIIQRQQIKWLLPFFMLIGVTTLGNLLVGLFAESYLKNLLAIAFYFGFRIASLMAHIAILLAILRYRLWEVDLVINRSLVYGAVTIILALLFAGSVFLIQGALGAENSLLSFGISALPPILLFNPARKQIQHLVDRYIYRLNFDLNDLSEAQKPLEIANRGALTGKTLSGYEVRGLVGAGGMGEVYEGYGDGQRVAIKTMLPKLAQDSQMRKRFEREAEAGLQLQHPNIAKVFSQGDMDGTLYLIMEYVEGQDLSQKLKVVKKLSETESNRLLKDICAALDHAHSQGFVHRDLKPANIMIKPNGQAILMDFGVTKHSNASSSLTGTGAIGTIDYMAPEQIMTAKTVDSRADIYALGVMLYEVLTGEKPFKGSPAQVMFAHIQQPAPDPRELNPEIRPSIAFAILQALEKEAEKRFANTGELLLALT